MKTSRPLQLVQAARPVAASNGVAGGAVAGGAVAGSATAGSIVVGGSAASDTAVGDAAARDAVAEEETARAPADLASSRDDATLVALVLSGDRDAFEALYRRHAAFAINLATRLQGNRMDVEDLVHDAFIKAHQQLENLREPSAFRAWFGSILVSQVRTRLRRARWFRGLGLSALFGPSNGTRDAVDMDSIAATSAGPDLKAELAQVYALLRMLPADERIAWTLRFVERHRLEAVATMTQCSLATAKRRIQRAQHFLDEHYVASEPLNQQRGETARVGSSVPPPPVSDPAFDEPAAQSTTLPRRSGRRLS